MQTLLSVAAESRTSRNTKVRYIWTLARARSGCCRMDPHNRKLESVKASARFVPARIAAATGRGDARNVAAATAGALRAS